MALSSLTLYDFSDRDLLYALEECGDNEGYATAEEVARKIGIRASKPNQSVGSRFAWLRRFGIMDFKPGGKDGKGLWRLNETGESLLHPKDMSVTLNKLLDKMTPGQRVKVMEIVSRETAKEGRTNRQAAHLTRRAFRHSMDGWKDPKIANAK